MVSIITTVGPSSLDPSILLELKEAGATDFRINLSHCDRASIEHNFELLRASGLSPSIDTQGAQLRVISSNSTAFFNCNDSCVIAPLQSSFTSPDLVINHQEVIGHINVGDKLRIDFGGLVLQVSEVNHLSNFIRCVVINSGSVFPNRAVDVVNRPIALNALTTFDKYAISKYFKDTSGTIYCSFASSGDEIRSIRELCENNSNGVSTRVVSKIESKLGLSSIEDIIDASDAILIDRGDLSREISISRIPLATKSILNLCTKRSIPCYVATNILDSMLKSSVPSRAEISDLYTLLDSGASGIVLAAEVAIGDYPVDCVKVVKHMINLHCADKNGLTSLLTHSSDITDLPLSLRDWL